MDACDESYRWYLFSQTPEPKLALISERLLGNRVDVQEIKARLYGINVDP